MRPLCGTDRRIGRPRPLRGAKIFVSYRRDDESGCSDAPGCSKADEARARSLHRVYPRPSLENRDPVAIFVNLVVQFRGNTWR
jgi:hypothetical protein